MYVLLIMWKNLVPSIFILEITVSNWCILKHNTISVTHTVDERERERESERERERERESERERERE